MFQRMRAGRAWRLVGALIAFVLTPSLAPDLFHVTCPHHAGHQQADAEHQAHGHAHASHGETGTTADRGPSHSDTAPPPPCTCAGECPVSSTVEPTPILAAVFTLPASTTAARFVAPAGEPLRRHPERLQPPANAPPHTSRGI